MIFVAVLQIPPYGTDRVPLIDLYDTPDKPARVIGSKSLKPMSEKSDAGVRAVLDDAEKAIKNMRGSRLAHPWQRDKLANGKWVALVDGPTSL